MINWFKNLKVGSKLIFGFSIMILIIGTIGYMGYNSVSSINLLLDDIFVVRLPSTDYLLQADRDLQQLLVAERSMIFTNTIVRHPLTHWLIDRFPGWMLSPNTLMMMPIYLSRR